MEHTWGESIWHYNDEMDKYWSNSEFHQQLKEKQTDLMEFIGSWKEQRDFGINVPMKKLRCVM